MYTTGDTLRLWKTHIRLSTNNFFFTRTDAIESVVFVYGAVLLPVFAFTFQSIRFDCFRVI